MPTQFLPGNGMEYIKKTSSDEEWIFSSKGIPSKFVVTNLQAYNRVSVISTAERKLKTGMKIRNRQHKTL